MTQGADNHPGPTSPAHLLPSSISLNGRTAMRSKKTQPTSLGYYGNRICLTKAHMFYTLAPCPILRLPLTREPS